METIVVDGIEIEVSRKRIKNLYIRIKPPEGRVCISAPTRMNLSYIHKFAESKIEWIKRHKERCEKYQPTEALSYVPGEVISLRGKEYPIDIIVSKKNRAEVIQERITLWTKENSTVEQRKRIIEKKLREILNGDISVLAEKWQRIIGVRAAGFSIRNMKTRWGTCNTKTKKIWISYRLVHKAPRLLEYVVVHELVHLLEKSHNAVFKGYMDRFLPEWRSLKKELNQFPCSEHGNLNP